MFTNRSQSISLLKVRGLHSAAALSVPGEGTSFDKLCLRSLGG